MCEWHNADSGERWNNVENDYTPTSIKLVEKVRDIIVTVRLAAD